MATHRLILNTSGPDGPVSYERFEDGNDTVAIATLERKGWVDLGEYFPPPPSPDAVEHDRQVDITNAANALVSAASGTLTLPGMVHTMMRALKRVRKEARSQASAADIAELDQLEALADYVEAVRAEESRLLADVNLTVSDANWPTI